MIIQVHGEGSKGAPICIVGEAPGSEEAKAGRPFVGASGKLLDRMLAGAGILRSDCYITNVIKVQPSKNNIAVYLDLSKGKVVETQEYREYEQYLFEELAGCKANVFVPVGAVSLYALTRLKGITKWRGSILTLRTDSVELNGRKCIPCIHPAAALRQYIWQYHIQRDLRRVKQQSTYPEVRLPKRELEIRPSFDRCVAYLTEILERHKIVAYDIEVKNLHTSCVGFSTRPDHAICIPFIDSKGDYFTTWQEGEVWRLITKVLENKNIVKVAQNAIFDATFLHREYGIRVRPVEDTMVAHGILFPEFPKGLDYQTSTLTDEPYYKEDGKMVIKGLSNNDDQFWIYNCKDAAVLMEILPKELHLLEGMGNHEVYQIYCRMIEVLAYIQEKGIKVDLESLRNSAGTIKARMVELEALFEQETKPGLNPRSPKQLCDFYYKEKKFAPYLNRKTGGVTTDTDAMKRLARKGAPGVKTLQEYKKLQKLSSSYLEVELDKDGRLRGSYNPVGTITGRLSSSTTIWQTGLNMQNMPPDMRAFLFADEGYMAFNADLSQAENRIVAYLAPEPTMIRAFEQEIDIHAQTASMLHGISFEEVSDKKGTSPFGDGTKSQRDWGKQCNHSLNYDLGYKSFSYRFELPETQGKQMVEAYHRLYPNVRGGYHRWVQHDIQTSRTVENCYGRRIRFMDRLCDELYKGAYAWIPQSTVAVKINVDGLLPVYEDQETYRDVELLNQIHDSIEFQIPVAVGWRAMAQLVQSINIRLEKLVPWRNPFMLPSDVKAGICLGAMKKVGRPSIMSIDELADSFERIYTEEKRRLSGE